MQRPRWPEPQVPEPQVKVPTRSRTSPHPRQFVCRIVQAHWTVLLVVLLVALRVGSVVIALEGDATRGLHTVLPGDVKRYHAIAVSVGTPYRDFPVEYPPVTLGAIELLDGSSVRSATVQLMWSQLALDLVVAVIVAWGWRRRVGLWYLILGTPFVFYPFLYLRLDLLSVALAVGGLAYVRRRHPLAGGALLALACLAKLWPIVIVPSLVLQRSWRAVAVFSITLSAGIVAWVAWGGTAGPVQVLSYRGAPGWEIESTIGSVLHAINATRVSIEGGAWRIGSVPTLARWGLTVGGLLVVAGIWVVASRTPDRTRYLVDGLAPVAAITALLLTSTILSPQYMCWLVPFAAIATAYGARIIGLLTFFIVALSTFELNLVKELIAGAAVPQSAVLVRNVLLVALCIVSSARLVRASATR